MSLSKRTATTLVLGLAVTGGLWAQRGGGGMMGGMPSLPGLSNPTVGSGSEYLVTSKGKEMDVTTVALGKEDVDGAAGFWMETRMTSPDGSGEMVMKMLTVSTGPQPGVKRMIMQRPGQPPMEMPTMMMSMMQQHQPHPTPSGAGGAADRGELVGTESVTVPAGTFSCQHYHKQEQHGPVDMWISTDVTPYAMVKLTSSETTMVLKKTLTNETSHIKGEPQKFQMPQMPN
ncbi:MAG: hypothetical protein ACLQVG_19100 [Terriglobia bacterium]